MEREGEMEQEIIETDVLCIGGGIAGLMAAIRASEIGAKVIIAEKANTVHSGNGTTGNDHFMRCYVPEVHGSDYMPVVKEVLAAAKDGMKQRIYVETWMQKSFDIVQLWESWGIPMKYHGKYEFAGHDLPGHTPTALKYSGQNQKSILTREALKRKVTIMNRVMVFDMINHNGGIIAFGLDTRREKLLVFRAKSLILGTGLPTRLYPSPTPSQMFNVSFCPANTGDGRIMAYKVGAELANLELTRRWAGPRYFARCGKATWVGVLRDPQGEPAGPFVTKPDRRYGDLAADFWTTLFEDFAKSGKGPVYMDCSGIAPEDYEYMMYWMVHEGNTALLDYLADQNIDVRKHAVEFGTYETLVPGGVYYNEKGETSVSGLYATGDETMGGISNAATMGWLTGENAAAYARTSDLHDIKEFTEAINEKEQWLNELSSRKTGVSWQEVNNALQQIMYDYAGNTRSQTMINAGLTYLARLKEKAHDLIQAANTHELMNCLETLNLLDLGELVLISCDQRKETRQSHVRTDYPFTNPLLNKLLIVRKVDEKPLIQWKELTL